MIGPYFYHKERPWKNKLQLRCAKHQQESCFARAVIDKDTLEICSTSSTHSCTIDPMKMRRNRLEEEMKSQAEKYKEVPLPDIFRTVSLLDPEAAKEIDYGRMANTMHRRRQRML